MKRLLLASLAMTLAPSALAQDAMTQLGTHEHGSSELSIAIDPASGQLLLEMSGPAYNVYGFERAPRSDAELELVNTAHTALLRGDQFAFTDAAGCVWVNTEVSGGPVIDGHSHGHDHDAHDHGDEHDHGEEHDDEHHAHDDHAHDDHHDHDDHDEHDHGGHDHGDEGGHSDMLVTWNFQCERAGALNRIDAATLFEVLPSLESLNTQFFDGTRAEATTLTRERTALVID